MRKYQKAIVKATAKEVLLSIFDLATPFFEASSVYRVSAKKYREERGIEQSNFKEKISYLKRHGLIEELVESKEKYLELTTKGIDRIRADTFNNPIRNNLGKWDKKWRVVIFDIPEKRKTSRDILRHKLVRMGFEKIQESVYVFPFECTNQISTLAEQLLITKNVLIMISDIIQGEEEIIDHFINKGVLSEDDLR